MPSSINGIGTNYYGKSNVHRRFDRCEKCGKEGELRSFDTGLYFCLVFVPVIPLGKKRVFDMCPSCRVHRVMKLAEWDSLRAKTLAEATAGVNAMPLVVADAIAGLGQMTWLGEREEFFAAAERVRARCANDVDVLQALAGGYTRFGAADLAVDCQRDALALKDDNDVRRALAVAMMRAGRPEEAKAHIDKLIAAGETSGDKVGVLYLQVEALQAKGHHQDALALIATLVDKNPALATDKELLKLRATSLKHKQTNKPIVSKTIRGFGVASVESGGGFNLAALVWPLVLAAAPLGYVGVAYWQGGHRTVHIVNGLDRPYTVVLDGTEELLRGGARSVVTIAEGTHTVRHDSLAGGEATIAEFTIATPFWKRPFTEPTWVVNPDRSALLLLESTVYRTNPDPADMGSSELRYGKTLQEFHDVDYPFGQFPETISTGSKDGRFEKWRLDVVPSESSLHAYSMVMSLLGQDAAADWARIRTQQMPEDALLPLILSAAMPLDDFLALAKPFLERDPLLLEWHRAYQHLRSRGGEEEALIREYDQRLAARPDDPERLYLRGRLASDPKLAATFYQRAIAGPSPSAHALHALAFQSLSQGEFEAGAADARRALEIQPANPTFLETQRQLYLATGQLQLLLEATRGQGAKGRIRQQLAEEATLQYAHGDRVAGDAALAQYLESLANISTPEQRDAIKTTITASGLYLLGERDAFVQAVREATDSGFRFEAAVTAEDVATASSILAEAEETDFESQLALYLVAEREGDSAVAAAALAAAIELLRAEGAEHRVVAEALAGSSEVGAADLRGIALPVSVKRLALTALGVRDRANRATYFALARRLNFDRVFPHLLIRDIAGS